MSTPHKPLRVLMTGGGGFIGSHLSELLLDRGDTVTVVDDFSTGRRGNLGIVRSVPARVDRYRVIEGTVSAVLPSLSPLDFDCVYHLAAAVGVRMVVERPIHTIETNVHETSAVLKFCAERTLPVLIASTSEVYGKGVRVPMREDDDVVYGSTGFSRWCYACSKAIDEYLALAYHREFGLPAVIARFFNTVGPRQIGEYGMVLPRFVAAALDGRDLEVHGDGMQSRCFCDVRDVVRVLPKLVETPSCHGRVFNIGREEPITIRALAELVVSTLGSPSKIRVVPYETAFAAGFDDLLVRQPDLTRIRQAVGFSPEIPLVQTIRDLAVEIRQRGGQQAAAGVSG
ncbi:MAG: NAD-dependent epimerase/dehydratase family protein [bacterium]|jgi:UDP-glucose 4-epimerase